MPPGGRGKFLLNDGVAQRLGQGFRLRIRKGHEGWRFPRKAGVPPEPRLIRGDGRNEEGCVSDGHCGSVTPDSARRPAGARISTNGMAELICSLIVAMPAVFVAGRANDGARHCSSEREGYVEGDRSHPSGHSCRASGRSTCAGTVCGGQGGLGSARMLPGRVWPR